MTSSRIRIADTRAAADFASFAEILAKVETGRATAQRAELHLDLPDDALTGLAARASYKRASRVEFAVDVVLALATLVMLVAVLCGAR